MHLGTLSPKQRTRLRRTPEPRPRPRPAVQRAQARAQRSGGSQDVALYTCDCGYAFKAQVTTSVGCPQCGTAQAW
jgi:hypothetical protein